MSKEGLMDKTEFLYTAPNARADAVELVAAQYPDEEISAKVMPIRSQEEAIDALARVIMRAGERWNGYREEDRNAVATRYTALGYSGASSQIEVSVPGGVESFDWDGFYEQVEACL
jgi:hypothetical protein